MRTKRETQHTHREKGTAHAHTKRETQRERQHTHKERERDNTHRDNTQREIIHTQIDRVCVLYTYIHTDR